MFNFLTNTVTNPTIPNLPDETNIQVMYFIAVVLSIPAIILFLVLLEQWHSLKKGYTNSVKEDEQHLGRTILKLIFSTLTLAVVFLPLCAGVIEIGEAHRTTQLQTKYDNSMNAWVNRAYGINLTPAGVDALQNGGKAVVTYNGKQLAVKFMLTGDQNHNALATTKDVALSLKPGMKL